VDAALDPQRLKPPTTRSLLGVAADVVLAGADDVPRSGPAQRWQRIVGRIERQAAREKRITAEQRSRAQAARQRHVERRAVRCASHGLPPPTWDRVALDQEWPLRCTECNRQTDETWTIGTHMGICFRCARSKPSGAAARAKREQGISS
jgi:hypothetical protein